MLNVSAEKDVYSCKTSPTVSWAENKFHKIKIEFYLTREWILPQQNKWPAVVECRHDVNNKIAPLHWKLCLKPPKLACTHPKHWWKTCFVVPVLFSIKTWQAVDENMASIYTASHSWKRPIFIEPHLLSWHAQHNHWISSIGFSGQMALQILLTILCSYFTTTMLITSVMMKDSRCHENETYQNLNRTMYSTAIPLRFREGSLGSRKIIASNALSVNIGNWSKMLFHLGSSMLNSIWNSIFCLS